MSFVTSGYAERATLDFQIKLHNISHDLEQLGGALGYVRPEGSPPVARNETAVWKCPLGRENTVEGKGKLAVSKADFLAVLAKHPALVQRLCTVYFQDYIWCARRPPPAARARRPRPHVSLCAVAARCADRNARVSACHPRSLGFPLPPECEGGRELAWLEKQGGAARRKGDAASLQTSV